MQSSLYSQRWAPFVQPSSSQSNSASIPDRRSHISLQESIKKCISIGDVILHDISDKCSIPSQDRKHTLYAGLQSVSDWSDSLTDLLLNIETNQKFDEDVQFGYLHEISFFKSKVQELLDLRVIGEDGYSILEEDHGIFQAIIRRIDVCIQDFIEGMQMELRFVS